MNFTIVHIAIAFTVGYILGAIGMWLVQRIRKEPNAIDYLEDHSSSIPRSKFEGLDDDSDKTRIQTRPNLTIAKAPEPANFEELDSQGSLEMVEILPESSNRDNPEYTEDFDDSSLPGIELPLEDLPDLTDNGLEDALGSDDTVSFIRPKNIPSMDDSS